MIANGFGVRPLFVWQTVPAYHYNLRYHFLSVTQTVQYPAALGDGYALVDNLRAQGKLGPNVLWLADMQQDKQENLYVDGLHYTAAFSKEIAGQICGALSEPPNGR